MTMPTTTAGAFDYYATTLANLTNPPPIDYVPIQMPMPSSSMNTMSKVDSTRFITAVLVIIFALFGILSNTFIVVLSVKFINGDYRQFIANLAIVDIMCAFIFAFMGYTNLPGPRKTRFSASTMAHLGFAFYGSFGVMICALLPISISRVVAAARPKNYGKFFSGRRPLIFCVVADSLPLSLLMAICFMDFNLSHLLLYSYSGLTFVSYFITFLLNILVFRIVARHIKVIQSLFDKKRMIEIRQVAIATLAQAVIPLVCQVPAFISMASTLLFTKSLMSADVMRLMSVWLASGPLMDSLITIMVIKQYRKQTMKCLWCNCLTDGCVKKKTTLIMELTDNCQNGVEERLRPTE